MSVHTKSDMRTAPGEALRVISRSGEPFRDRSEAGQALSTVLEHLRGQRPVVLGIPRGGVVVARALARALGGDLDIVLARKLRTPGYPELAMGAVSEDGRLFLNESLVKELGIGSSYIEKEKALQAAEIARRAELVRRVLPKVRLQGRTVVVTDDGAATGATAVAALWAARHEHPQKLIAAMPVVAEEAAARLAQQADEVVCLRLPVFFGAVGQFYLRFEPVEDEEVLEILKEEKRRKEQEQGVAA